MLWVSTLTSLKFTSPLVVVMANEKPLTSTPVVPVLVRVTSKLLDDEPGTAVMSAMPKTRPARTGAATPDESSKVLVVPLPQLTVTVSWLAMPGSVNVSLMMSG